MTSATTHSKNPSARETRPGPLQIELRFELAIAPAAAFDLVTNRLPEWFGAIHAVRWDNSRSAAGAHRPGACSERVCDFGGKELREEIVSYEQDKGYTYRARMDRSQLKMPLEDHLGSFDVEPTERGSAITWRQYFRPRWYVPGAMLRWQMRDRLMRPAVDALIAKHGGAWIAVR